MDTASSKLFFYQGMASGTESRTDFFEIQIWRAQMKLLEQFRTE